jgi:hypothetical protein
MTEASGAKFNKMKKTYYLFFVLALTIATTGARAQFPNFPAATASSGPPISPRQEMQQPHPPDFRSRAVWAIDPLTGKLFVASAGQNRVLRFASARQPRQRNERPSPSSARPPSPAPPRAPAPRTSPPPAVSTSTAKDVSGWPISTTTVSSCFRGPSTLPGFAARPTGFSASPTSPPPPREPPLRK